MFLRDFVGNDLHNFKLEIFRKCDMIEKAGRHNINNTSTGSKRYMKKHATYSVKYRWTAFILCLALCAGSSPIRSLAADGGADSMKPAGEQTVEFSDSAFPEAYTDENMSVKDNSGAGSGGMIKENSAASSDSGSNEADSAGSDSGDNSSSGEADSAGSDSSNNSSGGETDSTGSDSGDNDNSGETDSAGSDSGDNSSSGEADSAGSDSSDNSSDGETDSTPAEDTAPGSQDEGTADSTVPGGTEEESPDNAAPETPEDKDDAILDESISGNDSDAISDNDLGSVSDNNMTSLSENDLDEEWEALVKEAQEAFDDLLADKDMMALIYHADSYDARREADRNSAAAATLAIGQTVYIKGVTITQEDVWYHVRYLIGGAEGTGYVQSYYLAYSDEDWLAWEEKYLHPVLASEAGKYGRSACGMKTYSVMPYAADNSDISAFPGSYQSALRSLKNDHPNWTFVPMNTGLDFNDSVTAQMKDDVSLIQNTQSNIDKGWVGAKKSGSWHYATRSAVTHYMDPRNFLTESYIFQFEQLTFNSSYHTQAAVQNFLNNTFMAGVLPDDAQKRTYAGAFFEIGKNRRLSPIHLASRVYQEQGKGTSELISGKYPGYEGYYNFFNVNANGANNKETIENGLKHAKAKGWNTRYKSLDGGAALIGTNYILKYQDTPYLQRFNVDKNSPYPLYTHQYMQNIQAPASEAISTRKMYAGSGSLGSAFVFKIPVYNNMSGDQYYPVLKLDKTSITMNRSEDAQNPTTQRLRLYADDVEMDPAQAKWKSSDLSVATVEVGTRETAQGTVKGAWITAVDKGEAVITASYMDMEITCKVTVKVPLAAITLDKEEIRLRRPDTVVQDTTGLSDAEKKENIDTATLQVSFEPTDTTADRTIVWSSSNAKIAKVKADPEDSAKAVVTAVGKGEVTITAAASLAGNRTAKCKVFVSAPITGVSLTNPNAKETDTETQTTLLAGQSVSLAAEYWPKDTTSDTRVTWSTSNPKAAVVSGGRVTAVGEDPKENKAVITAKVSGCEQGYTAQHTVVVQNCTVTFMKRDGKTVLKKQNVLYGDVVAQKDFPVEEEVKDSLFIGWYTGQDGTGSRFDDKTMVYRQNTVLYPYYEEQGKGFYVLPVGDQTFTGSAIKPTVQVYDGVTYADGSRELIELEYKKDYTVSYKNNKNVNTEGKPRPTITIKGKGNYSGTEYVYFDIVPKALTDTDITAEDITVAYSGRVIKSAPVVYRSGKKLTRNTHYTVTYPQTGTGAYQTAGTYPVVITGKGGYSGTVTVYETITNEVLMSKVSVAKIPNQTYLNDRIDKENGDGSGKNGIIPEALKVTYKTEPLTESTDGGITGDYTVSYKNNLAVGTAAATITAVKGSGFTGSKSVTYKIVGTSIAGAKAEGLEDKEYVEIGGNSDVQGDAYKKAYAKVLQTPGAYSLTLGDRVLTESMDGGVTGDYVVSYAGAAKEGAVKAGTATIIFKGINEYTGQLKKTYKITGYQIDSDTGGCAPAITMEYATQDAPDTAKAIASLSEIVTPYVKGGSKPTVKLYYHLNGEKIPLVQGKDYTVKYANNNAVTPVNADAEEFGQKKLPKITVTGKGNFKGTLTGDYTITDGRLEQDKKVTMYAKDVVYQNRKNSFKGTVTLTDCSGVKLAAGRDYDRNLIYTYESDAEWTDSDGNVISRKKGELVQEEDIPGAGTVIRVTAQGIGAYAGTQRAKTDETAQDTAPHISAVYRIVAADIGKAKVKAAPKEYYNGREVFLTQADLTVTMNGISEPLVYGRDYIIDTGTYNNNRNKGKANVTIRGLDNYGGEKKITYTINSKMVLWWKNLFF